MYFCKLFDGARHDSGDAIEWGERLIAHYEKNRVDPRTKTLVFSDSLDFPRVIELYTRFNITVEKSTFNTLTLLLTIGTTRSKCSRLYDALMRIAREKRAPRRLYRTPTCPRLRNSPACRATPTTPAASCCRYWTTTTGPTRRCWAASAPTRSSPTRPAFRCWCPAR
jgi:hypothetical protein